MQMLIYKYINTHMYVYHSLYMCMYIHIWASLAAQLVKNPPAMQETWVDPWVGKFSWRKDKLPHSSILGLPSWLRW